MAACSRHHSDGRGLVSREGRGPRSDRIPSWLARQAVLTGGPVRPAGPLVGPGMRRSVRELLGARDVLSAECAKLLEVVKARCPDLLPVAPLPAGTVGPEVDLNPDELQQ